MPRPELRLHLRDGGAAPGAEGATSLIEALFKALNDGVLTRTGALLLARLADPPGHADRRPAQLAPLCHWQRGCPQTASISASLPSAIAQLRPCGVPRTLLKNPMD